MLLALSSLAAHAASPASSSSLVEGPRVEDGALVVPTTRSEIRVVPVYHATTRISVGDTVVWLDPWSKANLEGPKADIVLITDVHPDHLDLAALEKVSKPETVVVAPPAVPATPDAPTVQHVLANGAEVTIGELTIAAVPMYNLVRGPEPGKVFHDPGRGNGYVLRYGGEALYFAGDTECTPELKALTGVDVAFLPMNLPYTMPPEEAAACVNTFRPQVVVPYHYAGSDLEVFRRAVKPPVQVLTLDFYPGGLPW